LLKNIPLETFKFLFFLIYSPRVKLCIIKMKGNISPPIGNRITAVLFGIREELLNNSNKLKEVLIDALKKENFNILGTVSHKFKPQGYSIVVLLSESHASIHTYPEYNSLAFDLYSCRGPKDGRKTYNLLVNHLKPKKIDFKEEHVKVKP